MHGICCCWFFVFLIIGLSTFFSGCNTDLDGQCTAYDVVEGVASKHTFYASQCSECVVPGYRSCITYRYYDCYGATVEYQYVGSNNTCYIQTSSKSTSNSTTRDSVNKYPIGDQKTFLDRSGYDECMDLSFGMGIWITGVVFLCLTTVVLILWVYMTVNQYYHPDSVAPYSAGRGGIAMTSVVPGSPPPTPGVSRGAIKVAVAPRIMTV